MNQLSTHPTIVVGVDGSTQSELALDWAVDEASRRHLRLHLMCASGIDYASDTLGAVIPVIQDECKRVLRGAAEHVASIAPTLPVTTEACRGQAAAALVALSAQADTVVVGSRGHGSMGAALAGSTSLQVAAHASCPVAVVRTLSMASPTLPRVVVGVDGSPVSSDAIGYAFAQAAQREVGLTVVHAWDVEFVEGVIAVASTSDLWERLGDEERALTAESVAGWAEKYPDVDVRTHVVRGHPVDVLVSESEGAELIVVGSRGRGGFSGLLMGSVSHGVLHRAQSPVVVVRPHPADGAR